jgi:hypothetical protein
MTGTEFLLMWSIFPLTLALTCGVVYYLTRPRAH